MFKRVFIIFILLLAVGAGAWYWLYAREPEDESVLTLYGNVDLRQVNLAFKDAERIATVAVEEGDLIQPGQVVATLETERLQTRVSQAEAQIAAQEAVVAKLEKGPRRQEIDQARAALREARVERDNAQSEWLRRQGLLASRATSQEEAERALTAKKAADEQVAQANQKLDLLLEGTRSEDIDEARAMLKLRRAQLAELRRILEDSILRSPAEGVLRNRLLEPGDMASPTKPVLTLALTSPKWVRAYVGEPNLGRIRPGMKADITTDADPGRVFEGWIGFISPMAEFTPRTVETEELRTALMYEIRVFTDDPDNRLRLGMPATVRLDLTAPGERRAGHDSTSPGQDQPK